MSDAQLQQFRSRLQRIDDQHGGTLAGQRGHRAQPGIGRWLVRTALTVVAVLMLAKAAVMTGMGAERYADRHAELGARDGIEGGLVLLLAPDPVAGRLAQALRLAGLSDGWASDADDEAARVLPQVGSVPPAGRLPQIGVATVQ